MNRYLVDNGSMGYKCKINVEGVQLPDSVFVCKNFDHSITGAICQAKPVKENGCIYIETEADLSQYDLLMSFICETRMDRGKYTEIVSCIMKSVGAFPVGTYSKIK